MQALHWQAGRFRLDLRAKPLVMGIVNVTPDSFSDGGHYSDTQRAFLRCEQLVREGADILDIGGESTRPGATVVPIDVEIRRLLPVLHHALQLGVPISVDTNKPAVMQAVLDAGADIINDVWALRNRDESGLNALEVVAGHPSCGVCLMHMHREPLSMQVEPMQGDVLMQVQDFLTQGVRRAESAGIGRDRLCVDVGIGFGKTVAQNFSLLQHQERAVPPGVAVLAGWSRKSSLAAVTGLPPVVESTERLIPSVTAAVLACERGAHIVRVHDVRETVQALCVWQAMRQAH